MPFHFVDSVLYRKFLIFGYFLRQVSFCTPVWSSGAWTQLTVASVSGIQGIPQLILPSIWDDRHVPPCLAHNFLILMKSSLSFVVCAFGVIAKKTLPNLMFWKFPPMFLCWNYILLALTFRSVIHFKDFIFLCSLRMELWFNWSNFYVWFKIKAWLHFFGMWLSSFSSTISWKDYPLPI